MGSIVSIDFSSRMTSFSTRKSRRKQWSIFLSLYRRGMGTSFWYFNPQLSNSNPKEGTRKTPFGAKSALFSLDSDFLQSAYDQQDMSLCKQPNQQKNHRIWRALRVLRVPSKQSRYTASRRPGPKFLWISIAAAIILRVNSWWRYINCLFTKVFSQKECIHLYEIFLPGIAGTFPAAPAESGSWEKDGFAKRTKYFWENTTASRFVYVCLCSPQIYTHCTFKTREPSHRKLQPF